MSRGFDRPAAPKPYDFVPIAAPSKDKTIGHERVLGVGYGSGRLTYDLHALTPVFVASGSYALGEDVGHPDVPVIKTCYRVNGVLAIPGSTLKGCVRSIAEAISPSCVAVTRLDRRLILHQPNRRDECKPGDACPACSIFGRMNRISKVFFEDAWLVAGNTELHRLPALYAPRAHRARRTYQTGAGKFKGRKFYFHGHPREDHHRPPVEVIAQGSVVQGMISFENLSLAEMGLLFFALGLDGSFVLKLGGGKPACLGSMQINPLRLELLGDDHFLCAEASIETLEGEAIVAYISQQMRAAVRAKLILKEQVAKLRQILRYPNERECPVGMY